MPRRYGAAVVDFRRLTDDDLPMLHRWLNEPGVVRWWEGDDVSWEGVVRDYGSQNPDPVEHWLGLVDGEPVGWIQCWDTADDDDGEAAAWVPFGVAVGRGAAGIDYLVADPAARGRGVGSTMIRAFTTDVVFGRHPHWTQSCASPFEANTASWRALEKAGYRRAGIVEDTDGPCVLMVAERSSWR